MDDNGSPARDAAKDRLPQACAPPRDFLYRRRLVAPRPFVTDDGVPGLNLRLADDETIAVRVDLRLLDPCSGRSSG